MMLALHTFFSIPSLACGMLDSETDLLGQRSGWTVHVTYNAGLQALSRASRRNGD